MAALRSNSFRFSTLALRAALALAAPALAADVSLQLDAYSEPVRACGPILLAIAAARVVL